MSETKIFGVSSLASRLWNDLRVRVGVGIGVVVCAGAGWSMAKTGEQTTDNAQVQCDMLAVPAQISGVVAAIEFKDNQAVTAGDVLVRIDPALAKARLAKAEGDLASIEKGIIQASASIEVVQVALRQAESNLKRQSLLYERSVISKAAIDAAQGRFDSEKASLAAAFAGAASLASSRKAVAATREVAALDLSYTTIVTKQSGFVANRKVTVGQMVDVGQPIVSIVTCNKNAWIEANFKETQVGWMRPGQRATVTVDAYPGLALMGEVESLSGATGARFSLLPPENATGNFNKVVQRIPVRIRLIDVPRDKPLRAGMSVIVAVHQQQ